LLAALIASCGKSAQPPGGEPTPGAAAAKAESLPRPAVEPGAAALPAEALTGQVSVFDFAANRVHATVHLGGHLVADAGDVGFLKFVDGGWKTSWILGAQDGGRGVAFVNGLSGTLFLPVDHDGDGAGGERPADLTLGLSMRAVVPKQRVSIFVNEKAVGTIDVEPTWKDHAVTIPAAVLVAGENRVRLTFRAAGPVAGGRRSAAAIGRVTLGAGTPPVLAGEALGLRAASGRDRALVPSGAGRVSYYVQIPTGGKLALAHSSTAAGARLLVRVARDGAQAKQVADAPSSTAWSEGAWDLSAFAGHAVRLDLVGRGGAVALAEPRLLAKSVTAPEAASPKRFERIFVWMVDTLRADKVRIYNPKTRVETPNYDAFARDATRFAWAHVPGTWSLPSHASILTGVYPTVHKATAHEARLSPKVPFVAELVKKAGYRTGLFSSNGYVSGKWGFDRGWDINRNFIRESLPNGADYLWKTAKTWMGEPAQKGKPQFLYLATVEPHVIYNPRKEFLAKYWQRPYTGPIKPSMTGIQLGHIKSGKLKINDTDKAYLEALHDAEITQSDAAFGAFLADLKTAGIYDSSAIIVISDHGDEFWEHGDVGHAQGVHQELVHVPLIIRAPGALPFGKVVEADVEAMDLHPTFLELAGLEPGPDVQGSSLVALARGEGDEASRPAMSQNLAINRGVKVGRYRFIHGGVGRVAIYDVVADPLEQRDVAASLPIAVRQMRGVLGLLVAFENRWKKRVWGTATNVREAFYVEAAAPGSADAQTTPGALRPG
jgi:arylsulfatase A-like enzyme